MMNACVNTICPNVMLANSVTFNEIAICCSVFNKSPVSAEDLMDPVMEAYSLVKFPSMAGKSTNGKMYLVITTASISSKLITNFDRLSASSVLLAIPINSKYRTSISKALACDNRMACFIDDEIFNDVRPRNVIKELNCRIGRLCLVGDIVGKLVDGMGVGERVGTNEGIEVDCVIFSV